MSHSTVEQSDASILALRFIDESHTVATLRLASQPSPSRLLDLTRLPGYIDAEETSGIGSIADESGIDSESPIQIYLGADAGIRPILLLEETDYEIELIASDGCEIEDAFPSLVENSDSLALRKMLLNEQRSEKYILNFRSFVGNSDFDIIVDGRKHTIPFEVRSKKLSYRTDYPHMMQDVADFSTSLLLQMKSPVYRRYDLSDSSRKSRYEEFMILDYIFGSLDLIGSYGCVKNSRHRELENFSHPVPASLSGRIDPSNIMRMISADNLVFAESGPIASRYAPITVYEDRSRVTFDTPENRLIKDVLLTVQRMVDLLSENKGECSDYVSRRLGEMKGEIDRIAGDGWLKEISDLTRIPTESAVLERKPGYSDMFAIHRILGMNTLFSDDYGGLLEGRGSRIHQVYEFWCYTRLFRCLWRMSENKPDPPLIPTDNKWAVSIKRGKKGVKFFVPGTLPITVSLYYNKEFSRNDDRFTSYSLKLRPDFVLIIGIRDHPETFIINFDAKYKVKRNPSNDVVKDEDMSTDCWEYDIYKMHTYRDALLHSYGSYVMYPGNSEERYIKPVKRMGDVLPSVGAVPLVPGSDNDSDLEMLLRAIFDDIATFSSGEFNLEDPFE